MSRINQAKMKTRVYKRYSNPTTNLLLDHCKILYEYGSDDIYIAVVQVAQKIEVARCFMIGDTAEISIDYSRPFDKNLKRREEANELD